MDKSLFDLTLANPPDANDILHMGDVDNANDNEADQRLTLSNLFAADYKVSPSVTPSGNVSMPSNARVLSLFQSNHGWTKGTNGTISNLTSSFVRGTQSLRVTTNNAANAITLTLSLAEAVSFSNKTILLWVRCSDVTKLNELKFSVSDQSNFSTSLAVNWGISSQSQKFIENNTWIPVTFTLAGATATGSVNLDSIIRVRLTIVDAGQGAQTVDFNELSIIDSPDSGVVSFSFDDAYISQWNLFKPALDKYGYKATAYVVPANVDEADLSVSNSQNPNYLTTEMLLTLQRQGWQIAIHDGTPTSTWTGITAAEAERRMVAAKKWGLLKGFRGVDHVALPQGAWINTSESRSIRNILSKYFRSARTMYSLQRETLPVADFLKLRVVYVTNNTTVSSIQTILNNAVAHKEWVHFVFHVGVTGTASEEIQYNITNFNSIVDHVNSIGLPVLTVDEVLNSSYNNQGLNPSNTTGNSRIFIAASNAPQFQKDMANAVCTGTNDHLVIQAALDALDTTYPAVLELSLGSFSIGGEIWKTGHNIEIKGQGVDKTVLTATAATFNILRLGNRQADGVMRNNLRVSDLTLTHAGGASNHSCLVIDGGGRGSQIRNVRTNEGKYGATLIDMDRSWVDGLDCNNPRTAGLFLAIGTENTFGKVAIHNSSFNLSVGDSNASCVLMGALPTQTNPNPFDVVSFDNCLFFATNNSVGTFGLNMEVGGFNIVVANSQFESPKDSHVYIHNNTECYVTIRGTSFIQNSGITTNAFRFSGANHRVTVDGCLIQQVTNVFNGASGAYPHIRLMGFNRSGGNITNFRTGDFGPFLGDDTIFAGDNSLGYGVGDKRASEIYSTKLVVRKGSSNPSTNSNNTILWAEGDGAVRALADNGDKYAMATLERKVTGITPSQANALNATPIVLVSAPGNGKAIVPVFVIVRYYYGSAAFGGVDTADDIQIGYAGGLTISTIETTGFVDQTGNRTRVALPSGEINPANNTNLVIRAAGNGWTGGTGCELQVDVYYRIVKFA